MMIMIIINICVRLYVNLGAAIQFQINSPNDMRASSSWSSSYRLNHHHRDLGFDIRFWDLDLLSLRWMHLTWSRSFLVTSCTERPHKTDLWPCSYITFPSWTNFTKISARITKMWQNIWWPYKIDLWLSWHNHTHHNQQLQLQWIIH